MKIDGRFPRQIALTLVLIAGCAAYPLLRYGSNELLEAFAAGAVLSTLNVLAGYLAIVYAIDKSYTTFLKAVLGGMGIRMLVMFSALLLLIKGFAFNASALTVSLLGFYVIFLTLEILFIHKTLTKNEQE